MQPAIQQELEKKKTEHLITFKVFQLLLPHFSLVLPHFLSPPNQHSLLTKKKKKKRKKDLNKKKWLVWEKCGLLSMPSGRGKQAELSSDNGVHQEEEPGRLATPTWVFTVIFRFCSNVNTKFKKSKILLWFYFGFLCFSFYLHPTLPSLTNGRNLL